MSRTALTITLKPSPMSALKKQSPLRWSHRNERTPGGAIYATVWTASLGQSNYPGTRTLDWRITVPGRADWWQGGDADRFEFTVATLKEWVYERAMNLPGKPLVEVLAAKKND